VLHVNGVPQQYSAADAGPFRRDLFEDAGPDLAIEHLEACDHYVLALPGRQAMRNFGPFVVPADQYFMMGDSRDNSADSRFIGPVPRKEIVGRVPRVILSFDPLRYYAPRLQRVLQPMSVGGA
jgi:signal peptidase I